MRPRSALEALQLRPAKFLTSLWPWRSFVYVSTGSILGLATIAVILGALTFGVVFAVLVVGLAGFVAVALSGVGVARIERWRIGMVEDVELTDPHRAPAEPGVKAWVKTRLRETATWRELGYTMVMTLVLCWLDTLVIAIQVWAVTALLCGPFYIDDQSLSVTLTGSVAGVFLAFISMYPLTAWAGTRAAITRAILAPRIEDDPRLVELKQSRANLIDAFEVERRRIERDLHDGAQQRLVALNMQLGLARLELTDGGAAAGNVERAHELAKEALAELRELIRGVHPKILTDRGLYAALQEVADRAPIPVDVEIALPQRRLPEPVEVTAYFVVAEALANVAKHSGAARARVVASVAFDRLTVQIRDDGRGGADADRGTGLAGLAARVAAVGGTLRLASPPAGPTVVHVDIPCG